MGDYMVTAEEFQGSAARVIEMHIAGAISVHVGQTYQLSEIARAHADLESRRTLGSSVILP